MNKKMFRCILWHYCWSNKQANAINVVSMMLTFNFCGHTVSLQIWTVHPVSINPRLPRFLHTKISTSRNSLVEMLKSSLGKNRVSFFVEHVQLCSERDNFTLVKYLISVMVMHMKLFYVPSLWFQGWKQNSAISHTRRSISGQFTSCL